MKKKYLVFIVATVVTIFIASLGALAQSAALTAHSRSTPAVGPMGVLSAYSADAVFVNGNRAQNGMTILSDTTLETKSSDATVSIPDLGRIQICPETKLHLNFTNSHVSVQVSNGNASLTTDPNVDGDVVTPKQKTLKVGPSSSMSSSELPADLSPECACRLSGVQDNDAQGQPATTGLKSLAIAGGVLTSAIIIALDNDAVPIVQSVSVIRP